MATYEFIRHYPFTRFIFLNYNIKMKFNIKIIIINVLFLSLPILSSNASITSDNQGLNYLISALTKIDKPKSLKVAKELQSIKNSYDLIIRNGTIVDGTGKESYAIEKISNQKGPLLKTISMSFNKDLKDNDVVTVKTNSKTTKNENGYYEFPYNWTKNN